MSPDESQLVIHQLPRIGDGKFYNSKIYKVEAVVTERIKNPKPLMIAKQI